VQGDTDKLSPLVCNYAEIFAAEDQRSVLLDAIVIIKAKRLLRCSRD
jgi:hypothetical protein